MESTFSREQLACAPLFAIAALALGLVLGTGAAANAAVLAYEPFDLDPGGLRPRGSGFGWGGIWGEQADGANVTLGSLVYPPATSTAPPFGNKASQTGGNQAAWRDLDVSVRRTSGTVYISFLFNPGDTPVADGTDKDLYLEFGGSFTDYGIVILATGNYGIRSRFLTPLSDSGIPATPNETVWLVARYDIDASRVDLFVNPGPTEPATPDASLALGPVGGMSRFRMRSFNTSTILNQSMDEILYADSYSSLLPAPVPAAGTTGLMIMALMALLAMAWIAIHRRPPVPKTPGE